MACFASTAADRCHTADPVADPETFDLASDFDHFTDIFVAKHAAGGEIPALPRCHVKVGSADAAARHAQQNVARAGHRIGKGFDLERACLARALKYGCSHGPPPPLAPAQLAGILAKRSAVCGP